MHLYIWIWTKFWINSKNQRKKLKLKENMNRIKLLTARKVRTAQFTKLHTDLELSSNISLYQKQIQEFVVNLLTHKTLYFITSSC